MSPASSVRVKTASVKKVKYGTVLVPRGRRRVGGRGGGAKLGWGYMRLLDKKKICVDAASVQQDMGYLSSCI